MPWSTPPCFGTWTPVWRRRFLTWGIVIAVFGMRIIFPLAIVAIAARLGPIEALCARRDRSPPNYQHIIEGAHVGIAGFGGAFLAMVGLKFFFDAEKDVHWIEVVEWQLTKLSSVPGHRDRHRAARLVRHLDPARPRTTR